MNKNKSVMVIFRRGGRTSEEEKITIHGIQIQRVNCFKYLRLTLQTIGHFFREHVRERVAAAIRGIFDIEHSTRFSLQTAMTLFRAKIIPVVTYEIELI